MMKYLKPLLIILLIWVCFQVPLFCQLKTAKLVATFDEKDKHYIDTVYCKRKYETTFILPEHRKIAQAVVGDPDEWEVLCEPGGRILSVKPLHQAGQTSLTIITRSTRVYKFNIVNIDTVSNPGFDVMAVVQIREQNTSMRVIDKEEPKNPPSKETLIRQEQVKELEAEKQKEELMSQLNASYVWSDHLFAIERVYDDGIFTYIVMPESREVPQVYRARIGKEKIMLPVYTVFRGGTIVLHFLVSKEDMLVLMRASDKKKESNRSYIYRVEREQ